MKNVNFDGFKISIEDVSSEFLEVITLVADKEYGMALQLVNEYISKTADAESKNIEAMISLQILAMAGYKELASVLLNALVKNFKMHSKARHLCKETISIL